MKVTPVFADSLGAKSFCVRVDTGETSLLIDPGAAPFPKDHPTMSEEDKQEALLAAWSAIEEAARGVEHLVVTHWHGDHYSTLEDGVDFDALYGGRVLWVKDPRVMINPGQERKAHAFFEDLVEAFGGDHAEGELPRPTGVTVRGADGAQVVYDRTAVSFSRPLPHGEKGSEQGYVLGVRVTEDAGGDGEAEGEDDDPEGDAPVETFVHSSDVQGPGSDAALDWLLAQDPTYLALDGPPTYLVGRHGVTQKQMDQAFRRARKLLKRTDPEWVLYDHHLCRDPGFREACPDVWELGAVTVAEFLAAGAGED